MADEAEASEPSAPQEPVAVKSEEGEEGEAEAPEKPEAPKQDLVVVDDKKGSSGVCFYAVTTIFGWLIVMQAVALRQMFQAPRCMPDAADGACLKPMFQRGEPVDFFVYVTTERNLRWWTRDGYNELRQVLLWNRTGMSFGEEMEAALVTVPLSLPSLHGVRRNETTLYAHCYMARAGAMGEESFPRGNPAKPVARGILNGDVLHTKLHLTRLLVPRQKRAHRNLLSADDDSGKVTVPKVPLPFLAMNVTIHPDDALMWVGSVFAATAFLEPAVPVAAFRGGLCALVSPWLFQLYRAQQQEQRKLKRERALAEAQEFRFWAKEPPSPHLAPRVQIGLAMDEESYDAKYPSPLLYQEVMPDGTSRDHRYMVIGGNKDPLYVPPLAIDHFGLQQKHWRPLDSNTSREDPVVELKVDVTGMIRYSMMQQAKQAIQVYMQVGFTERDLDDLVDFFFRYPVHIIISMYAVGFIQTALWTLAFKNDITFFRGRSDYTGLSSRSLGTDTLQEIVIFLYLWDIDHVSRLILFEVGAGAVMGAWKYACVARMGLFWRYLLPWLSHGRGGKEGVEESTEEMDAKGMRYLKFVLYPLSAAWGIYNLYGYAYKSWWSWLISSMADFAYTFGFINMMPQIFINYKLKSVAHMPWRVLMFKFFKTFIDDVFAFFIMKDYTTTKYRWMTLRDDVVFFIFLYQRYIYKIDPTRPDEFGFVYTEAKEAPAAPAELTDVGEQSVEEPSAAEAAKEEPSESVAQEGAADEATVTESACGTEEPPGEGPGGDPGAGEGLRRREAQGRAP